MFFNNTLLLLVLIPPIIVPWVVKLIFPRKISWKEQGLSFLIGIVITTAVFALGVVGQTSDDEIWNGYITNKTRDQGSYVESYDCHCRTVSSGSGKNRTTSTQCDTCYRDHYTVRWTANSTVGSFTIQYLDQTTRLVYLTPDPARYTEIKVNDPACAKHSFTNYVKAVPESLFHANLTGKFDNLIPEYPLGVYDYYKINRAIPVGVSVPDINDWNKDISDILKTLGPGKQANVIVLFVKTNDESYVHALEGKWIGGKKNDIIVIIGTTAYPKIDWVAVSSWTDRALFKVQLRDDIMSLGTIDRPKIIQAIQKNTLSSFQRKHMKDFEYLQSQIEPPLWVLILAIVLGIAASLGTSYMFYKSNHSYRGIYGKY